MPRFHPLLIVFTALSLVPTLLLAEEMDDDSGGGFDDQIKIFNRKRNAHACMMSNVFLVLYPLGAISLHLPLPPFLKNIRIVPYVHAPIQIIGLAVMIGALGLGIDIARELDYFSGSIPAHVVIGLLATSMIILIQPAMGILQHLHFRKTGGRSIYGYIHRWNGRVAIILGMINQGLGFQLAGIGTVVHTHSLVRNFLFLGVLGGIWFTLAMWDGLRVGMKKKSSVVEEGEVKQENSETSAK